MWTRKYWQDLAERAIKSFAGGLAAILTAGATSVLDVDWTQALSVAALAAAASVLTSIASAPFGTPQSASLVSATYAGRHRAEADRR